MKYKIITIITALIFSLAACKTSKKTAYVFAPNTTPEVKAQLIKMCDKGKILYGVHCAKCHNKIVNGKEQIPDFPANKLEGYKLAILNPTHANIMRSTKVAPNELMMISQFLTYKKKNPVPKK